jgi:two-component system response regulator
MNAGPILVLDDDADDRLFLELAFRRASVQNRLEFVHDGAEAVEHLSNRAELPLLVFLDLKTPRLTGIDVLRWIRSQAALRGLVVVMLTASPSQLDIDHAYAAGANAFLVKPGGLDRLTTLVKSIEAFWLHQNHFPSSPSVGIPTKP